MDKLEKNICKFVERNPFCWTSEISNAILSTQADIRKACLLLCEKGIMSYERKGNIYKWKIKQTQQ